MLRNILIFCTAFAAVVSFGADGPENTGTFTIKPTGAHLFETQLQIDKKVFDQTFGPQENALESIPAAILGFIEISSDGRPCQPGTPAFLTNDEVISGVLTYDCQQKSSQLTVALRQAGGLPTGFTLGVRTDLDHFVLTLDAPVVNTIISPVNLFFRAGLGIMGGSAALEKARVGRPHALYYGGLSWIPPGMWLLLLLLAFWTTSLRVHSKIIWCVAATTLTGMIAGLVLYRQASLALIPVRQLGFIYLTLLGVAVAVPLITRNPLKNPIAVICLGVATLISGLEHAVILRWLEGMENINLPMTLAGFFIGAAVPLTGITIVLVLAVKGMKKAGSEQSELTAKVALLALILYPAVAMLFKIQ